MRIGVAGITGRMGRLVAEEIVAAGATLSGGIGLEGEAPPGGAVLFRSIGALAGQSDAIIDFTHASTVPAHARGLSETQCAWILGTTGLSAADQADIRAASRYCAVIQAANFSPGVNLVLALARSLGAALPGEE